MFLPDSPVLTAQGSLDDTKPVPMDPGNPSVRSDEQVWHLLGTGTNNALVTDDLMFESWLMGSAFKSFCAFLVFEWLFTWLTIKRC